MKLNKKTICILIILLIIIIAIIMIISIIINIKNKNSNIEKLNAQASTVTIGSGSFVTASDHNAELSASLPSDSYTLKNYTLPLRQTTIDVSLAGYKPVAAGVVDSWIQNTNPSMSRSGWVCTLTGTSVYVGITNNATSGGCDASTTITVFYIKN